MIDRFKLTPDEQRRLTDMSRSIAAVRETIDAMERIGLDVEEQKAKLEQYSAIRAGLLREFGNPVVPRG